MRALFHLVSVGGLLLLLSGVVLTVHAISLLYMSGRFGTLAGLPESAGDLGVPATTSATFLGAGILICALGFWVRSVAIRKLAR